MSSRRKGRRPNKGSFRPGYDPRRHAFTDEERKRGHERAKAACSAHSVERAAWFFRHIRSYFRARRREEKGHALSSLPKSAAFRRE